MADFALQEVKPGGFIEPLANAPAHRAVNISRRCAKSKQIAEAGVAH